MGIEFRSRDYRSEREACSLLRVRADVHPLTSLSTPSPSSLLHPQHEVDVGSNGKSISFDPLRGSSDQGTVTVDNFGDERNYLTGEPNSAASLEFPAKEWETFKRILMQRFPVSKIISNSAVPNVVMKSGTVKEKSVTNLHLEELDDPQKFSEEGVKCISQQEYFSRLCELKDEINRAWQVDDYVTSLKLTIKVARLLMDTSVIQFYPTLFVLATDVMDMLGDMVWERIMHKAQYAEDGAKVCSLPVLFEASDICFDARETCCNWFCKIGSIRDLLPRIYLELAILPCSRFLLDKPEVSLHRLATMTRGIADPLASAYCRLYMAHCAQKLPVCDRGFLITSINDLKVLLMRTISMKESSNVSPSGNPGLLLSLIGPAVEYIVRSIFKDLHQTQISDILMGLELQRNQAEEFGKFPCISILLYHILKELPNEVVISSALEIFHLIESSKDGSIDQYLNYRLFGFRLCEVMSEVNLETAIMDEVIQVVSNYNSLDKYLMVVEAYLDIVLQNRMDNYLHIILDNIFKRACTKEINENELDSLQSVLLKIVACFNNLKDILALNHFLEILYLMRGSSRSIINIQILNIAVRNDHVHEPTTIQFLFDVSRSLHNSMVFSNMRSICNQQPARLISRFVQMVDYGPEVEYHLAFLNECRGAFANMDELKETIVHASNRLAIKSMKDRKTCPAFIKSCLAFSEATIPSIPAFLRQLNLYIETAEVALLGGLVSHSDGLIDSAISCLQNADLLDGLLTSDDFDGIDSLIRKFCSFAVMVPGNPTRGVAYIPKSITSFLDSKSWMTDKRRVKVLCAVILLSATLCQPNLPYSGIHEEVVSNGLLFFGDSTYLQEFLSFSTSCLQNIVNTIQQERSQTARGNLALEACYCIALSFRMSPEILAIFSELMETAKLCCGADDTNLQFIMKFVGRDASVLKSGC